MRVVGLRLMLAAVVVLYTWAEYDVEVEPSSLDLESSVKPYGDTAYIFSDVCTAHNIDADDQELRSIIYFDKTYNHPKRCVPCNNPVMAYEWDAAHTSDRPGVMGHDYVRDESSIKSGHWQKEGGLISDGGHKCGMMWVHKIMAKNLEDYNKCTALNANEIKDRGQRYSPSEVKKAIYHSEPTLMMLYKNGNPGHQLMDSLLSAYPLIAERNEKDKSLFSRVINSQDWNCKKKTSHFICSLLEAAELTSSPKDWINTNNNHTIHCFKKLYVPIWGLYGRGQSAMPKTVLTNFRNTVLNHWDLDAGHHDHTKRKRVMLFYGHFSTKRRKWTNMRETMRKFSRVFETRSVYDFGALPLKEQAKAFNEADVLALIHGGEMANVIYCHEGAYVYEISCTGYSHVRSSMNMDFLGINFHVISAPTCEESDENGQGRLDWNVLLGHGELANFLHSTDAISSKEKAYITSEDTKVMHNGWET